MRFRPFILSLAVAGMLSLYSCGNDKVPDVDTIGIGSFNIEIFGQSKARKKEVMSILANILSRYDIVAIQEIRDKSMSALPKLIEQLDEVSGKEFDYVISPRLGRSNSKEQYAFIYNTATLEYTGSSFV